ncbi:hypothetical protein AGMMS49545_23060 [Betaproteobacteria bacterium]|nr:hypothetical protein AGMMS49545_23060 [Betaproteobacteria bacterium]GHU47275.1 hypothetical protein AGMMS50289_22220 [Betaproteobacteria bacterium]
MKKQFLRALPFLLLLSLLSGMAAADGRREVRGEFGGEFGKGASPTDVAPTASEREEKRQFKSLWRQLSRAEQDALRQQMRAAWQRLTPEERQRALAIVEHSEAAKARAGRDEKHHKADVDDERYRAHEKHKAEHKAYWKSLSAEERAALLENLRTNLRETVRRRCQNQQSAEGKDQKITCAKAPDR